MKGTKATVIKADPGYTAAWMHENGHIEVEPIIAWCIATDINDLPGRDYTDILGVRPIVMPGVDGEGCDIDRLEEYIGVIPPCSHPNAYAEKHYAVRLSNLRKAFAQKKNDP